MAYQVAELEISKALERRTSYEYALVYRLSEIVLCRMEQLETFDLKECVEARFFSADKELHLFETEEGMCAVEVTDDGATDCILKEYELAPKFAKVEI